VCGSEPRAHAEGHEQPRALLGWLVSSARPAPPRRFPSDFVFGVATAAYQVEGHIENDWSEWERAGRMKHVAGAGVDHWNRWSEDYQLARGLGSTAFRMSLEWARIEPQRGRLDDDALDGYRRRLVAMA